MKKNYILAILTSLLHTLSFAQPYGNEWISYTQPYLTFPVIQDGVHKIEYGALQEALANLTPSVSIHTINPKNIQIFGRGVELYIHVEGEADSSFDPNDFIEFYAQKNDGWADSLLYRTPDQVTNPYYSLFTDTAYYYLTLNTSTNNKRLTPETNTNFQGTPIEYFFDKKVISYNNVYQLGKRFGDKYHPYYTIGEGWTGTLFDVGSPPTLNFDLSFLHTNNNQPITMSYMLGGYNNNQHHIMGYYGNNQTLFLDSAWNNHLFIKESTTLNNVAQGNLAITFEMEPFYNNQNVQQPQKKAIGYFDVKYPHTFNMEGKSTYKIELQNNGINPYYLYAQNFNAAESSFLYDLTDHRRVKVVQSGSVLEALVPASNSLNKNKTCYLFINNSIQNVTQLFPVNNEGFFTNYENLDPLNAYIILTHTNFLSGAQQYASYRNTINQESILVNTETLYDQFSYGIRKNPLAIKNFLSFVWDKWTTHPQYVFIIGKSAMDDDQLYRKNSTYFAQNYIPSFSVPPCDYSFTEGLEGIPDIPSIPIGRLAAENNTQVEQYLDKVITHEQVLNTPQILGNIEDRLWLKRILHFGGGTSSGEQSLFKTYLRSYQDTIESKYFGGKVFEFYKSTSDPIDFNLADSIQQLVNTGVSLLSFFGHSSGGGFDINIDSPENYDNTGKYFFLLSNGCLAGNIHNPNAISISEEFVLTPQKGAVAFIAQSHLGLPSYLNAFSKSFYGNISRKYYNESIGKSMLEAFTTMINNSPSDGIITTAMETTLHGDPALKMSNNPYTDYAIVSPPQISFTPQEVTTDVDSFSVNITVSNLGKVDTSGYSISLTRIFPSGEDSIYSLIISPTHFQDTVKFKLPVNEQNGVGSNKFKVEVDPLNFVQEMSESNNTIGASATEASLVITSNDLIPIYPYNYAVIDQLPIELKASTSSPILPEATYILQIDTTDSYSSPVAQETILTQKAGIVKWTPFYQVQSDSIVYFWRCSPYFTNNDSLKWREHSFQYINGKRGWAQDHFFQFKKDQFNRITYNKSEREITFDTNGASIRGRTFNANNTDEFFGVRYEVNGVTYGQSNCFGQPVLFVVVVDPVTLEPWEAAYINSAGDSVNFPEFDFGNGNNMLDAEPNACASINNPTPSPLLRHYFSFLTTDQEQMDSLTSMLNNKIPEDHYVMIYTGAAINFESNNIIDNAGVKQALANLGSTQIYNLQDNIPWIFFTQIGNLSITEEEIGTDEDDVITLTAGMKGSANEGSITSSLIGPAFEWNELHWNFLNTELNGTDNALLQVLNSEEEEIISFNELSGSVLNLQDFINADQHPYIKLKVTLSDGTTFYPAQNDKWRIVYAEAPEAALDYNSHYYFQSDSLSEGQQMSFSIGVENISNTHMDSLNIIYQVMDEQGTIWPINYPKQDSLKVGEIIRDTVIFNTLGHVGLNSLMMEVNPQDSSWQREQYHFNNSIVVPFYVLADKTNPVLDITFDGIHILDGDIVSPKPNILITLKDENQYLLLSEDEDTSNFNINLIDPSGNVYPVHFTNGSGEPILNYTKATSEDPTFTIEYNPSLEEDGVYKLRVQASDKAGNKSGNLDYVISFEVINRSTITQIMNYPNPFSTKTHFVFTLTGSKIPDVFKIQILTVSGKIVREITKNELGNIRIGRNITDYWWDGTDEYGDRLANGVYLYRVITKINNEDIELRQTSADQFFHKGFGKMYLMR